MAVAFDAITTDQSTSDSTLNIPHVPVGTPSFVLGILALTDLSSLSVSTATYGGQAMTIIGSKITFNWGGTDIQVWFYKRETPLSGNRTLAFGVSATADAIFGAAMSFTGTRASGATGTLVSATGSSTGPTVDASSSSGGMVVGAVFNNATGTSITAGAGQTQRFEDTTIASSFGGEITTEAGATTVTTSFTLGASDEWLVVAVPLLTSAVIPQIMHHRGMSRS